MTKGRLEAFSDGVIAIIITIMVLEIKTPHDQSLAGLTDQIPHLAIYALSFVYVGIYWNNHHHMFVPVAGVTGSIMWANLHLLFWLSLVPFASAWMGENYDSTVPMAVYGFVLLMAAIAYAVLALLLVKHEGQSSVIARVIGKNWKTTWSIIAYATGIAISFRMPLLSLGVYAAVAMSWLIPDSRIERAVKVS